MSGQWSTGFTADVSVTNSEIAPTNGWKAPWTATADYSGSIAPRGDTSSGFRAGYSGTDRCSTLTCTTR
ncbi:cellulose binding domain-containing protein [Catenulispora pinisilvae]|uniref:cellulose binding domain-containing protein n=1 Tax=Catenulispora pinisilvae TaxID=2705253 RepID=UPI0034DD029A